MREIAPGGGTVMVDMLDETAIAHGLKRLADEPDTLETLRGEASRRPIRAWAETTRDMVGALVSHSA
jgi:hypothetical protein